MSGVVLKRVPAERTTYRVERGTGRRPEILGWVVEFGEMWEAWDRPRNPLVTSQHRSCKLAIRALERASSTPERQEAA